MKVFVSYSFNDSELYILTLLFEQLRKNGFFVESADFSNFGLYNEHKISNSNYFIGIITNHSDSINDVIQDWHVAINYRINTILLVEDSVHIQNPHELNFIRFNRMHPQIAINQLLNLNQPVPVTNPASKNVEGLIAVGAIAVGLAALISLLSGQSKN